LSELRVLINGELAGNVAHRARGDLVLTYDRSWRDRADGFPVSLSMPLSRREHGDAAVRPFMEGLLPDNATILERWARQFHVSARNPFALLSHMGEDCAGAVQFVGPDRYEDVAGGGEGNVEWLTEEDVAERLRDLVEQHGTGRLPGDRGQFSLSGAQPKMALLLDGGRWGIPSGRTPTTHILKPPARRELEGFDINEHFCLRLGEELGLAVAESTLRRFGDQEALVVARYDRLRVAEGQVVRLHQEDTCQALAVSPLRKYQNEGGPGPEDIVALLLRESDDPETDVAAFLDALALSWVIGGTDAHAKNYSVLISSGTVRLAPFYDLISILPYPHRVHDRKAALAMRIDREYRLWKIRRRHWEGLAARCDLRSRAPRRANWSARGGRARRD
jgi:serine/threonine-protein kinase HipA